MNSIVGYFELETLPEMASHKQCKYAAVINTCDRGDRCKFQHQKCRFYNEKSPEKSCHNGVRCKYLHPGYAEHVKKTWTDSTLTCEHNVKAALWYRGGTGQCGDKKCGCNPLPPGGLKWNRDHVVRIKGTWKGHSVYGLVCRGRFEFNNNVQYDLWIGITSDHYKEMKAYGDYHERHQPDVAFEKKIRDFMAVYDGKAPADLMWRYDYPRDSCHGIYDMKSIMSDLLFSMSNLQAWDRDEAGSEWEYHITEEIPLYPKVTVAECAQYGEKMGTLLWGKIAPKTFKYEPWK
jgi:hypothetical protein